MEIDTEDMGPRNRECITFKRNSPASNIRVEKVRGGNLSFYTLYSDGREELKSILNEELILELAEWIKEE